MRFVKRIDVALDERSYPVMIGGGLLDRAGTLLEPWAGRGQVVIVTDEMVRDTHAARLEAALAEAPWVETRHVIALPSGEATKSWSHLESLLDRLIALGIERSDNIIALGGGVTGDLVGFAAAILKRGSGYIQIPTTLLAQVDSSVGGKTAINIAAGKNLVGAFHQPSAVLIDMATLATLPERQMRAGYAEVVKYGLIGDAPFFDWCETHGAALIGGDTDALLHAIETSVRAKAAIVAADERETSGRRALLNFGHTFGHALEAATGFSDRLLHGEAVALGMALAFRFSAGRGLCPAADADRVADHLRSVGLPASLHGFPATGATLVAHMASDKKRSGGTLPFILARGIGRAFVDRDVATDEVKAFLDEELR